MKVIPKGSVLKMGLPKKAEKNIKREIILRKKVIFCNIACIWKLLMIIIFYGNADGILFLFFCLEVEWFHLPFL